jgi:hypothetical protein
LQTAPGKRKATRGEWLQEVEPDSTLLNLPDVSPAEELVEWLMEAGPTEGDKPLSWRELDAWAGRTGNYVDEFVSTTLMQMSRAYFSQRIEARAENCPPPFAARKTAEQEKALAKQLRSALHAAAAARKNGKPKK